MTAPDRLRLGASGLLTGRLAEFTNMVHVSESKPGRLSAIP